MSITQQQVEDLITEQRLIRERRHTSEPVADNSRTCASCGSEEKIVGRWTRFGSNWVRLECTHVQNDDEH